MPETVALVLPVLPIPDGVVLPEMVITVALESDEARNVGAAAVDGRLLLVPRIDGRYARVGVTATIENRGKLPDGTPALTVRASGRARVGVGVVATQPGLWVEADPLPDPEPTAEHLELAAIYRAAAGALLDKIGGRRLAGALAEISSPGALADSIGYWPELTLDQRVELLETTDVGARLALATAWVKEALAELSLREKIQSDVTSDLEKGQREAILRRQLAAIRAELGEGDDDALDRFRRRLAEVDMPDPVVTAVSKELDRLERTGPESMEANWIRTWLDTVFELPWGVRRDERLDLGEARRILDADHTGLDEVKDRLVEHLAVRKLRAERGVAHSPEDRRRGVILALVGPPGVGKTSLGESVARALDRSFVRLALGGIRDEAEIRGHRRTYVGARPGRIVRALVEAGSLNPVILLDEVDKLGADWRGDPSAALLEVLDPAQNASFRDHYLEFELDLSDVVFLATANVLETVPGPLLDRLEVIPVDGYTEAEKAAIARRHLLPRLVQRNGLEPGEVVVPDEVIDRVAADWTREAGVRRLERLLDKLLRKVATKLADCSAVAPVTVSVEELREMLGRPLPRDEVADRVDQPGTATGLAVTGSGGDVLFVETALVDGEGEPVLTGQLGDVMKESASIARSLAVSVGERYGASSLAGRRLHVHFPAGAVPKDGPSAGVTMTTALVSLLSGRTVRPDLAMTGEVSLSGRVLPVGGIKQKVLAAHRAGLRTVVLPAANADDLDDVPAEVRDTLTVHLAHRITDVLDVALSPVPA